mgnify:CR=1 FL=1
MEVRIVGLILTLLLSAWFAGVETIFISFNKNFLPIWKRENARGSLAVDYLLERPERFLITTLTGNNLVNVIFTSLLTLNLTIIGISDKLIMVIAPTVLLLFGEIIPKSIARQNADKLILPMGKILFVFRIILFPAVKVIEGFYHILSGWLHVSDVSEHKILSKANITDELEHADQSGSIPVASRPLIKGLLKISEKRVSDIMTPRISVVGAKYGITRNAAIEIMLDSGHSRLPYYKGSIDNIVGLITARSLLASRSPIKDIITELHSVPAGITVVKLLAWFRRNSISFASVIDEYGGIAGVVSIEDLVEELVGPIQDEYDLSTSGVLKITPDMWLINAHEKISQVQRIIGIELKSERATSIGGLVTEISGEIPKVGKILKIAQGTIQVLQASPNGVKMVRLTIKHVTKSRS